LTGSCGAEFAGSSARAKGTREVATVAPAAAAAVLVKKWRRVIITTFSVIFGIFW
jgi:hypothetical protein